MSDTEKKTEEHWSDQEEEGNRRPVDETAGSDTAEGDLGDEEKSASMAQIPLNLEETLLTTEDRDRLQDDKFQVLEQEFTATLDELSGDPMLLKFRAEYEKLHKILLKARDNEKKLLGKCKDLNTEMIANAAKVRAAVKTNQQDRSTITSLKKEIKKAWELVEKGNEKESKSKESIAGLKSEISTLQKIIEQTSGAGAVDSSVNELIRQKEDLTKERDIQINQIIQLRAETSDLMERIRKVEDEKASCEAEIQSLKDMVTIRKTEADRELRHKDKLEAELKEARQVIEMKNIEIRGKQDVINRTREEVTKLETLLRDQKVTFEKTTKDYEILLARVGKLQQEYEEQVMTTTQLLAENQKKSAELKLREDDVAKVKEETRALARMKDALQKKLTALEDQKHEIESERDNLKAVNHGYERDIETCKRQVDQDRKQIDELMRERDVLKKNLQKSSTTTKKQLNLVKVHEQTRRNLEQEISSYKEEASKQRKIIYQLEKERDKFIFEASAVQSTLMGELDQVRAKENEIFEYKKKIVELETKLKQQQNLYEAVRADRNLYSKNLIESQDEVNEMKRKLKVMNHQIDQLKEEIQNKEGALVKEHFEHLKVEKEKEALKNELQKLKQQNDMAQHYIQSQQTEEHKLRHIIAEADAERARQKKEFEAVIQERDILGTQLIRRNDELALLYEKVKIQQSTLNRGEMQYAERLEDIRVLKLEIKKLRREKTILQTETSHVESARNEIYRLQRDILREKSRVKVLEDELQNPLNVHRWRKLEGSDPATFDLIQKVQTLQKRLIGKTEEVVEKELLIQQKEKLYLELKTILARHPGPEAAEQITVYQQTLKEKTNQLKAMASELNMYQAQVNEYKYEIDRLNRDMQEMRKKYFEQKKKSQGAVQLVPNARQAASIDSAPQSLSEALNMASEKRAAVIKS